MPELDWELEDAGPSIMGPTDARAAAIMAGFKMCGSPPAHAVPMRSSTRVNHASADRC